MTRVPIFDADNHLYEPKEALVQYLPERHKGVVDFVDVHGRTKIMFRNVVSHTIPNPTFEVVARPGAMEDYYRKGNPEGKSRREIFGDPVKCIDAWRSAEARIALLDEQGVDRTLMFPTLASLVEERMRDDPDLIHTVVHALNEWLYENWQFNYQDRIFTTPVISFCIVEKALEELEWVIERGAKCILVRPAPVPGYRGSRSPAMPEFDPIWERIVEADLLVGMHSSDSGYSKYAKEWLGGDGEQKPFQPDAFQMMSAWRPIQDTVTSMVVHGAFSRHPKLKVAVIENGASWLAPLLQDFKDLYKKMPEEFAEEPISQIKRNLFISTFWEEDPNKIAALVGEDNVLFGSDYPHPEGLAEPAKFADELTHLSDEYRAKFMGGNLARLMNIEQPAVV